MRLGLFGGTFDPVHLGHLIVAEQCREQCDLDAVWFIPAGSPPHKRDATITDGKMRANMLEFAVAGMPQFAVSQMELDQPGLTFTVDTLRKLHDEDPNRDLFFVIGADSLSELPTWRELDKIAELATIVVTNRGERPLPSFDSLGLADAIASRLQTVTIPGIDLSSSSIRDRVAAGQSIRFMVPRAVEAYIAEHGLYRE